MSKSYLSQNTAARKPENLETWKQQSTLVVLQVLCLVSLSICSIHFVSRQCLNVKL